MVVNLVRDKIRDNIYCPTKDKNGQTPLHVASKNGKEAIVSLLLEHGADVNAEHDNDGLTPLHLACEYEEEAVVALLLKKGADVNVKDND
jgi:ankyrin repeat protein